MLYLFFNQINPLALVFIYMPITALIIGVICSFIFKKRYWGSVISFFLPLLYITTNWSTFTANIDAWLLWGCVYALVAFLGSSIRKLWKTKV